MYTQINKKPILITHGNIVGENNLPNYSKGLQFMQAPGVFNSVDELYVYLSDNDKFHFQNYERKGSYYNKSSSHINERNAYFDSGLRIYQRSLKLTDEEAKNTGVWDLISNVRYQFVIEEDYVKDANYEFLLLHVVNVFGADIDVNSDTDVNSVVNHYLKVSQDKRLKGNKGMYCMVKENGVWKACSGMAIFQYMQEQGYLNAVKSKVQSSNFCDVESTVNSSGEREFTLKN